MEIKNFTITKRDGSKDRFSLDKIMNAICKAFESVNEPADLGTVSKILSHLDVKDDTQVEDIQNQVEEALMKEGRYTVAKSFILYRHDRRHNNPGRPSVNQLCHRLTDNEWGSARSSESVHRQSQPVYLCVLHDPLQAFGYRGSFRKDSVLLENALQTYCRFESSCVANRSIQHRTFHEMEGRC